MKKFILISVSILAILVAIEFTTPAHEVAISKQTTDVELKQMMSDAQSKRMTITITAVNFTEDGFVNSIEGEVILSRFVKGQFTADSNFSTITVKRGIGRYFPSFLVQLVNE
jgi:hypothetical protein